MVTYDAVKALSKWWKEMYTDEGKVYYCDEDTMETTWDKPQVLVRLEECVQARKDKLGPDWEEVSDDETGQLFIVLNGVLFKMGVV